MVLSREIETRKANSYRRAGTRQKYTTARAPLFTWLIPSAMSACSLVYALKVFLRVRLLWVQAQCNSNTFHLGEIQTGEAKVRIWAGSRRMTQSAHLLLLHLHLWHAVRHSGRQVHLFARTRAKFYKTYTHANLIHNNMANEVFKSFEFFKKTMRSISCHFFLRGPAECFLVHMALKEWFYLFRRFKALQLVLEVVNVVKFTHQID